MFVPMPIISRPVNITNDIKIYSDTVVKLHKKGNEISICEFKNIYKYDYARKAEWICKNNPDVEIYDIVYSPDEKTLIFYSDKAINKEKFEENERNLKITTFEYNPSSDNQFAHYCEKAKNGETIKEENEISLYDMALFLLERYETYKGNLKYYEKKVAQGCIEITDRDFSCTGIEIERNKMLPNRLNILVKLMFSSLGTYYHPKLEITVNLTEDNKIEDAFMKTAEDFHLQEPKNAFIVVNNILDKIVNNYLEYEKFMINYDTVCVASGVYAEIATNEYFHVKLTENTWSLRANCVIEYRDDKKFNLSSVSRKVLEVVQNNELKIFKNTYVNPNHFYKNKSFNFMDHYTPVYKTITIQAPSKKSFWQRIFGV